MSTSQASLFEWKQEVNRRIAEHRNRKGAAETGPRVLASSQGCGSRRGAEAAARVAERFAHAPRYTETLVDQARTVRADEHRHAPAARPTPQPVESGFKAAQTAPAWDRAAETHAAVAVAEPCVEVEQTPMRRVTEPRGDARLFGGAAADIFELPQELVWGGPDAAEEMVCAEGEPIHGNLIEFPRELVATRRIRPRLVEGPYASAGNSQLSIFEVDPAAVSTEVEPADARPGEWNQPEWSGIKLDAQPVEESARLAEAAAAAAMAAQIELAPMSRRLLALFVDATLISLSVIAAGAMFAANATVLPGPRATGIGAAVTFAVVAVLYELMFFTLARGTPGMKYACIGLRTFANVPPTREQRRRRLWATALSVLPVGLGLVWSLFDEERLCWHDRLSQTYLSND